MAAVFTQHTVETAPAHVQPTLRSTTRRFGFLPAPVGLMAEAPQLLEAFLAANALFDQCSLSALEREVVVMAVATRVECHYCVALHSATLTRAGTDPELLSALRDGDPLPDVRLEALRTFTRQVMDEHGAVPEPQLHQLLAAGFTARSALDVVLGVGVCTLSTYANRMTGAPVDPPFAPFTWHPHH